MARIPRFISERLPPGTSGAVPVSPQLMGMEAGAIARAGEKIEHLGLYAIHLFTKIKEKKEAEIKAERRAEEANIAGKIKIGLENDKDALLETWKQSEDYQNSEKSVDEWVKNAREKYEPMSKLKDGGESETLAQGIDLYISHTTNDLKKVARDRYREGLTRETKANWLTQKDFYIRDYANATTPEEKIIVRNNMEIEARELGRRMILWPEEVEKEIKDFDKNIDKIVADLDDVKADRAIRFNPGKAFVDLHDSKYLPNLPLKVREDKIDKANAAFKVSQSEQEKKIKEQEKLNHDNEDREIGDLFMKKDFTGAYNKAQLSKHLTGDEKRTWATSIESASKIKEDEIDPGIEASNYAFVNELIAKEVDPKTIRNYIMSYEFKTSTRQKLIDRLDTETDRAVNKAKSRAYDYMKSQIMPYGGMLAEVPPLQAANYTKSMNALDEWIDKQRKADKPITQKDIQAKSEELAITFQTSISERQDFTAKENKEYFESSKKKKEKKVETQPTEKYEVNKIYTDAQGQKAKYLGGGKWQLVK